MRNIGLLFCVFLTGWAACDHDHKGDAPLPSLSLTEATQEQLDVIDQVLQSVERNCETECGRTEECGADACPEGECDSGRDSLIRDSAAWTAAVEAYESEIPSRRRYADCVLGQYYDRSEEIMQAINESSECFESLADCSAASAEECRYSLGSILGQCLPNWEASLNYCELLKDRFEECGMDPAEHGLADPVECAGYHSAVYYNFFSSWLTASDEGVAQESAAFHRELLDYKTACWSGLSCSDIVGAYREAGPNRPVCRDINASGGMHLDPPLFFKR